MKKKRVSPKVKITIVAILAATISIALLVATNRGGGGGTTHISYISHDPISIYGNTQLAAAANGGGNGTVGNPYIIENYVISASSVNGIDIQNTTAYFIVRNCLIENGQHDDGSSYPSISLHTVSNGRIENNICKNNGCGIFLFYSSNNNLINNTCENDSGGGDAGIDLEFSSNYNNLTNNVCKNNNYSGIYLSSSSDYNNLTNNTCENSYYGIYLAYSSENNLIYHNNIVNNAIQAYDDSSNRWDNGYPSGGNYWSNYMGVDANGDGIGDTPYNISGGTNQDHYPLMNRV